MSKYDEMSDFDINMAVAEHLPVIIHENQSASLKVSSPGVLCDDIINQYELNFCSNPKDAWTIMLECGISIINLKDTTAWFACSEVEFETVCMSPDGNDSGVSCMTARNESYHTNPLRAAMIVFLMMKDGKNE